MSKMSDIALQVEQVEHDNHALRVALKWALEQIREMDHDCKAGPEDGCEFCYEYWEAGALIGMSTREAEYEPEEERDG